MKTPPLQQKAAGNQPAAQDSPASEGKSLAPPSFQLEASEGAGAQPAQLKTGKAAPMQMKTEKDEEGGNSGQGDLEMLTITNGNAVLRSGPPQFSSLGSTIPQGTRVDVLERKAVGKASYIRVKDHDTGTELGWTSEGNSADLDKRYKAAGASYTYHVDGHDLLVFVPPGGPKSATVNIFFFFHGNGGDYTTSKTHAQTKGFEDNPAISANMAQAVANSGSIAICPQGNGKKVDGEWGSIKAGGFKKMADVSLAKLSADLDRADQPLVAGEVSIAGHSAGGNALGQAALDTGATDVTLQDAGYNFTNSWEKLREWFLLGAAPKTARVITKKGKSAGGTATLLREKSVVDGKTVPAGKFKASEIISYSKQLAKNGQLDGPVTVEEFQGDGKADASGLILVKGYRVFRQDGSLQGSLRLYELADPDGDHWAVSSTTMETSMSSGKTDRAADEKAMEDR
jgi:hypothetical protein